jgi:5-methylcytosine-specific restriction endonuclease McrA
MSAGRNTTTRDRDRNAIRRTKPPCGICEQPIDYTIPSPDPMSFEVDHIIPLDSARTPEERAALDVLANKQAAHRVCNRAKWKAMPDTLTHRTFVTSRSW